MSRRPAVKVLPTASWVALLALTLAATPLSAAVVVTDDAAFVVTVDNNDAVTVDCSGGFLRVFDDGVPTTYTTACAAVTTLTVTATGNFDNTIDVSVVTAVDFPLLAVALLFSGGGVDTVIGSPVSNLFVGGPGNDTMTGGTGGDRFDWFPGDDSDTIQGGAGLDVFSFTGSAANEVFAVTTDGAGFDFTRDVGNIVMDVEGVETIQLVALAGNDTATLSDLTGVTGLGEIFLLMGDGDDTVNASAQANGAVFLTVFGGAGNDTLTGSPGNDNFIAESGNDTVFGLGGADQILGGDGDDTIIGGPGNESLNGEAGNDTFIWNPGDGSDFLFGEGDIDTMVFNGSAGNEVFELTAPGSNFRFTRDVGNIVMNGDVEAIQLNALAGNDSMTVGDLTTVLSLTAVNLFMGDGDDTVNTSAQANTAIALTIDGGAGNDNLTGSPNADTINGGAGNDTIVGLGGVDVMDGGDGDDTITGGPGNETQLGGAGNDTFIWNPGDGSDTLLGGAGTDTMVFNGSAGNEVFAVTAEGTGFDFTRDLGNIVMDAEGVEALTLNALGGDDRVTTVGLAGTSQSLSGGPQTTADVLTIDALGQCVVVSTAGSVTIAGAQPITFTDFEQVNVQGQCVAADVPTLGPLAMGAMAVLLLLAALAVMRLQGSA